MRVEGERGKEKKSKPRKDIQRCRQGKEEKSRHRKPKEEIKGG